MDEQKTMMFSFGEDKPEADIVIREVSAAMREKGYNPINQLVGYLLSGDPAYVRTRRGALRVGTRLYGGCSRAFSNDGDTLLGRAPFYGRRLPHPA